MNNLHARLFAIREMRGRTRECAINELRRELGPDHEFAEALAKAEQAASWQSRTEKFSEWYWDLDREVLGHLDGLMEEEAA